MNNEKKEKKFTKKNIYIFKKARNQCEEVHKTINRQLIPLIKAFKPQIILISAGFDAHVKDAAMNRSKGKLTNADFQMITKSLVDVANEVCQGRMVAVLEGGYSPHGLPHGVEAHITALLDLNGILVDFCKKEFFIFHFAHVFD